MQKLSLEISFAPSQPASHLATSALSGRPGRPPMTLGVWAYGNHSAAVAYVRISDAEAANAQPSALRQCRCSS